MKIAQPPNKSRGVAAIYARQSRTDDSKKDKQKKDQHVETTLDTQTAACRRAANDRGYTVSVESVYAERYTGAEMWDRPVLSELRRRIKAREYQALYVYSTDRLARDPIHLALILEECQRAGCELVFVTEPLEDSPEGELILYIKGYAAKIERLRIKDRMARGRNAITAAGKLNCSGTPLYGYKFDSSNRVRIINEETAAVVRNIFRWVADGESTRAVVRRLTAMHIPSPAMYGGRVLNHATPAWCSITIQRILKDETYLGLTHVNKSKATEIRNKKSGKYKVAPVEKSQWRTLPQGVTPAIISRELFDAAQATLIRNRRGSARSRNHLKPKLLRGVLFCADCGSPMYPMSSGGSIAGAARKREVYRCSASRRVTARTRHDPQFPVSAQTCKAKYVYASIEDVVWSKLVTFLLNPKVVEKEVERVLSSVPDNTLSTDLAGAEKQIERSRRLRDAALRKYDEAVADGDMEMAEKWDSKAKEANSDVRALAAVIQDITARLAAYNNSGKTARAFAAQCKKILGTGTFAFDEKRAAIEALNVKVFAVAGGQVRIQLNTGLVESIASEQSVKVEVCV